MNVVEQPPLINQELSKIDNLPNRKEETFGGKSNNHDSYDIFILIQTNDNYFNLVIFIILVKIQHSEIF